MTVVRGTYVAATLFLTLAVALPPVRGGIPPLMATDAEVRLFFADYVEKYDQKDLTGFLSLFSSKAVQNRKDQIGEIKKIYGDFFRQSRALRYRIDEMRFEIYQNGVEVEGRYRLNQVLSDNTEKTYQGSIRWVLSKEDGRLKILSLDYEPRRSS